MRVNGRTEKSMEEKMKTGRATRAAGCERAIALSVKKLCGQSGEEKHFVPRVEGKQTSRGDDRLN